jgi:hypothetical protein
MESCFIKDEELPVDPSHTAIIIMTALETFTGQIAGFDSIASLIHSHFQLDQSTARRSLKQ